MTSCVDSAEKGGVARGALGAARHAQGGVGRRPSPASGEGGARAIAELREERGMTGQGISTGIPIADPHAVDHHEENHLPRLSKVGEDSKLGPLGAQR